MEKLTQGQCDWIAHEFNDRPRERYHFRAPNELFYGKAECWTSFLMPSSSTSCQQAQPMSLIRSRLRFRQCVRSAR